MTRLLTTEIDRYAEVWATVPQYGVHSPGAALVPLFQQLAAPPGRVLDAGCGSGRGALALEAAGFDVMLCDLTDAGLVEEARRLPFRPACLWRPLHAQFEWVYCVDVLEHLPTALVGLAIDRLLDVAVRGVFVGVSTERDVFGAWVGGPLHQTVQAFVWWRDLLRELGTVQDARDLVGSACFLVTRRPI